MKQISFLAIAGWVMALTMAQPMVARGEAECELDVTGQYTNAGGNYWFFGDGYVTYDGQRPWYFDDTLACYETYRNAAYLTYFSQCDFDDSGAVEIHEVMRVYEYAQPSYYINGQQESFLAVEVGVESYDRDPSTPSETASQIRYLSGAKYNRISDSIEAIKAAYPVAAEINLPGSGGPTAAQSSGQAYWNDPDESMLPPHDYHSLTCAKDAGGPFAPEMFDELNSCYGATAYGELQMGTVQWPAGSGFTYTAYLAAIISIPTGLNIAKAAEEYNTFASTYGVRCDFNLEFNLEGHPVDETEGFHILEENPAGHPAGSLKWRIRAKDQCDHEVVQCACVRQIEVITEPVAGALPDVVEIYNSNDETLPQICTHPLYL